MNQAGVLVPQALSQTAEVAQVRFSALTSEEIEYLSAMEVTQSRINEAGQPAKGGVNDPRLGIVKPGQRCLTCGEAKDCQGHFGHVKLAEPVFHVGYLPYVEKILKCVCHNCGKLKFFRNDDQRQRLLQIFHISQPNRRLRELVALLGKISRCEIYSNERGQKHGCGSAIPTSIIIREKMRLFVILKENQRNQEIEYSALKVKSILEKITKQEAELLGFTVTQPIDLLISILAIAPPQVRPSVELGPQKRAEDDITNAYARIVGLNNKIGQLDSYERVVGMKEIQTLIASIMVKLDKRYLPTIKQRTVRKKRTTARKIKSLEERLVAKEGRFRQHLMGKRVDFSARSVISPDPFLALDEVGVPDRIAKNLTVPEEINELNFDKIVQLCKEGSVKYLLQPQVGRRSPNFIYLNNLTSPEDIQKLVTFGTIAERQLQDGDYVLFNRQPTLHRMSMMAHRVRILPLNTFRLNLSVCSPYNADFDGDQMNMHVPQSVQATAELKHIALVPKQVISPKNSSPVMGIVQDSLLGVYLLTRRDVFLTREQFMNLLVWAQPLHREELPMPCILKPTPLWSGKQILSYLLPQKLSYKMYQNRDFSNLDDRSGLFIRKGEIISGALQRHHVGPGSGALIHAIWMQIGPEATNEFITNTQRVVTCWLMNNSFSVGAADVMIDRELQELRVTQVQKIKEDYYKNLHMFRNLPKYINQNLHQKGKKVVDSLEFKINLDLNNALSRMQRILADRISVQTNNIYKMITAKSKGSETNLVQIMFCLGNQNVDGQRCPLGFKRRALPHFSKDDNSPEPRGFVFSSFFQGLKPHQFFFHSMAGREGLSDTAVKTSSIGYIQRKLVKALEDLSIRYDGTVRDSQNNLLQRCYGQDGFQPEYIEKHRLNDCKLGDKDFKKKYLWNQFDLHGKTFTRGQLAVLQQQYEELLKARQILRQQWIKEGDQQDIEYHCPVNLARLIFKAKEEPTHDDIVSPITAINMVEQLTHSCVLSHFKKRYNDRMTGLNKVKDQGKIKITNYLAEKEDITREAGMQMFHLHLKLWLCSVKVCQEYQLTEKQLHLICDAVIVKFKQAIAPPGEAIGSLAAQSIGEPTTQMTLNTFHLAGVSDKNVTLGIPRLRELLDVSKIIKTPYMTVYYYRQLLWEDRDSEQLQQIQKIMLSILPERHIRDCLSNSKIFFDPGEFVSNIDDRELEEGLRGSRTPIVLCLQFQTQRITSAHIWRGILQALRKTYGEQFDIIEYVGIGQIQAPQIQMRLTASYIGNKGYDRAMKHINQVQIELKDLFLSGMKGIKSIKTARKISYQYGMRDQMNSALELRQDELAFDAVGSNLKECLSSAYVNASKTTSNDLYQIYKVLGIEAARQSFMNQIKEILKPYSIYINHRHLGVLADWMTSRGNLTPVNRHGINRVRDVSILRKASFEETVDILYSAAVFSDVDQLKGVSERIVFGQKLNLGTNICEVYVDPEKVDKYVYRPASMIPLDDSYQPPEFPAEEGLNTPKGLATPELSFASSFQSPVNSQPSFSMSPSYSPSHRSEAQDIMRSSSPSYHRPQIEHAINRSQPSRNEITISPTYHIPLPKLSQEEKSTFIFASKSPSYDREEKKEMVRPTEDLKEEESEDSDIQF